MWVANERLLHLKQLWKVDLGDAEKAADQAAIKDRTAETKLEQKEDALQKSSEQMSVYRVELEQARTREMTVSRETNALCQQKNIEVEQLKTALDSVRERLQTETHSRQKLSSDRQRLIETQLWLGFGLLAIHQQTTVTARKVRSCVREMPSLHTSKQELDCLASSSILVRLVLTGMPSDGVVVISPQSPHRRCIESATIDKGNPFPPVFALPLLTSCKAQSTKKRTGYTGSKEYCNAQKFASLTTPFFVGNTFATVHSGHHSSM
eukprot:TRINITY_DN66599_c0_g1_i3.p1 TRINITY_DN66599_c0_g1~~TRINITY_DN66599_c0_g1_i3.p1  ORF type:complete len:265 (-),score=21.31 TRINITY_DN66599_c0_g1_i3:798-1592(-)